MITIYTHKTRNYDFCVCVYCIRMINLSLNELKLIAKSRSVKDYDNKFEDDLMKIFSKPKPKLNFTKRKIKEIKKDFSELRYGFSKSKLYEFRKSLYNIKNLTEIKDT